MSISNPHDRYFREVFSNPDIVRDLLSNYLPDAVAQVVDLTTLALEQDSFVDEELRQHYTDLLYTVRRVYDAEAFVYFLFEHKSHPDHATSFQVLRYMVRIWERRVRQAEPYCALAE